MTRLLRTNSGFGRGAPAICSRLSPMIAAMRSLKSSVDSTGRCCFIAPRSCFNQLADAFEQNVLPFLHCDQLGKEIAPIHPSSTWAIPLARAKRRFSRSADRRGAGPRRVATLTRRRSQRWIRRLIRRSPPNTAKQCPSRLPKQR